jgi:hypothetical protein
VAELLESLQWLSWVLSSSAFADLRVLLEVILQDDVLSKLLVVVLESRPGGQVRGLREARHVELQIWWGKCLNTNDCLIHLLELNVWELGNLGGN